MGGDLFLINIEIFIITNDTDRYINDKKSIFKTHSTNNCNKGSDTVKVQLNQPYMIG